MGSPNDIRVAEAMQRLWDQHRPQIEERVLVLELAAEALANRSLNDESCASARAAAHKLAGVLGTFGLEEGTQLAREAEIFYDDFAGALQASAERPQLIASRIRTLIESKK
ncbi:MAG TPA: Hpt domain-containing protein [Terracidiphilus sp.]|jgi:HPt (histidine-containing phosphotransfer) domain-containing protein|nr:Hpt domain-containing protein [Terracidiphilus sp.]